MRRWALGLLLLAAALFASCKDATQVNVVLRTNVPFAIGAGVALWSSRSVAVGTPLVESTEPWLADGEVGNVVVTPGDASKNGALTVRVAMGLRGKRRVHRRRRPQGLHHRAPQARVCAAYNPCRARTAPARWCPKERVVRRRDARHRSSVMLDLGPRRGHEQVHRGLRPRREAQSLLPASFAEGCSLRRASQTAHHRGGAYRGGRTEREARGGEIAPLTSPALSFAVDSLCEGIRLDPT
jgi:hypothetical protein